MSIVLLVRTFILIPRLIVAKRGPVIRSRTQIRLHIGDYRMHTIVAHVDEPG